MIALLSEGKALKLSFMRKTTPNKYCLNVVLRNKNNRCYKLLQNVNKTK